MKELSEADLKQFTGTEGYIRHGINRKMLYTDGVAYLAEVGNAYWLIDDIAIFNMCHPKVEAEEFQVWTLKKDETGHGATLTCEDGDYNVVFTERIKFTDFPLDSIALWVENNVIMLPSER